MTTGPAPFARLPWLTRRRLLSLAVLLGACVAAIVWNHRNNQRRFLQEIEVALPFSAAMTADALGDWVGVQTAYARALAAAADAVNGARATDDALGPMLIAAAAEGRYLQVVLRANTDPDSGRALRAIPADNDDSLSVAEFRVDVRIGASRARSLVLRAPITEASLAHFNSAADDDRTQRTLLVLDAGQSAAPQPPRADRRGPVLLLAVSHAGGGTRPPATRSFADGLDSVAFSRTTYRLPSSDRSRSRGIATGIAGTPVVYGAARVPGTPWILVREREVSEFMTLLAPALLVSNVVFGTLTMFLLGLILLWWRARYQQRERDAMELRATFVAGVSHELRTPLTQVRMYAEMLRLDLLTSPAERARALQVIEKEAERLRLLIERALWFVRSGQAPAVGVAAGPVAVHAAVDRAMDTMLAIAADRQVHWQVSVEPGLAVYLAADDLHQVLLNLFDNAVKYGPVGQTITVTARREGASARLVVTDQGTGISAAEEALIWQPFRRGRQAEETTTGTGIGLAVVRDIIERAGGSATVGHASAAEAGIGATIAITVPAVAATVRDSAAHAE